jgi:peptidyl-prolyl cis-trans isomerase B (cyclophilin B)
VAGKKERQRKLARERHERRMARQAQRQQTMRRTTKIASVVAVLAAVAAIVTFVVLSLNSGPKAAALPSATPTPTSTATPTPTPTPTTVAEPAHHCTYTPTPGQPAARNVGVPPAAPKWKAKYRATITTNRGTIVIDLLNSKATCTVNSFVYLASKAYYNRTPCHRLTTGGFYVLQCGDPTGTGSGGPGYQFADENLAGATYTTGTVAMANAGPGTNGSQFFLVYKNTTLAPNYTPFGTIVSGLKVILSIANVGVVGGGTDGKPKEAVTIEKVTITKT